MVVRAGKKKERKKEKRAEKAHLGNSVEDLEIRLVDVRVRKVDLERVDPYVLGPTSSTISVLLRSHVDSRLADRS